MICFVETVAGEQRNVLCQWVERFHGEGRRVQVVVDSTLAAQHLDQLLWTFVEGSFVPHRILDTRTVDAENAIVEPVIIVVGEQHVEGFDVLVCDTPVHLEFMSRYSEVVHFVLRDDSERRQESRLLWQNAREQGLQLRHFPYTPQE